MERTLDEMTRLIAPGYETGERGEVVAVLRRGDGQRARAAVVPLVLVTRKRVLERETRQPGSGAGRVTAMRARPRVLVYAIPYVLRAPRGRTWVSELPLIAAAWPSPGAQPA